MLILAVDTSGDRCGVLLGRGDEVLAEREALLVRGHAEALAPMVRDVLDEAAVDPGDVALLAVTTGPGTFTGVRVGVAFARGWALATGRKVLGVTALQAVAEAVTSVPGDTPTTAVLETRRAGVQRQAFGPDLRPLGAPDLVEPSVAEHELVSGQILVGRPGTLGEGRADLRRIAAEPSARGAWLAALRALRRGEQPVAGVDLVPVYLRPADADPAAGRSLVA